MVVRGLTDLVVWYVGVVDGGQEWVTTTALHCITTARIQTGIADYQDDANDTSPIHSFTHTHTP